jgi:hypothetical protein
LDATTIAGAIVLLFGDSVGDPAEFTTATETLKGVTELDQVQRGQIDPDVCDLFEDFVADPEEVLSELRSERPDRISYLEELEQHLPEEEAPSTTSEPDTTAKAPSGANASERKTLGGVSPDEAVVTKKAAPLTLSTATGDDDKPKGRPGRERRVGTTSEDPPGESREHSLVQPVRPPPSTELPEQTKAILRDPTYIQFVEMHLEAALTAGGDLTKNVRADSHLRTIGARKLRVEAHLRLLWSHIRTNKHITDADGFQELFGVTLPTT